MVQRLEGRGGDSGAGGSCSSGEVRLASVVSTFLVSFGVVSATIAGVLYLFLNGPDQPATIRRQPSRDKPRRRRAPEPTDEGGPATVTPASPAPRPQAAMPATPVFALPDSDVMRLRVLPAATTTLWVRIRSGVALVMLVAVLGAFLALAVAGLILGIALLVRSATG